MAKSRVDTAAWWWSPFTNLETTMFNRRIGMCIAKSLKVSAQTAMLICAEAAKGKVSIDAYVGQRINWRGVLGKTHSRPGGTHGSTRRRLFNRAK